MHTLSLALAPVLAAKSKTPFYVAGGVLVAWALIVGLLVGLNRPTFPGDLRGQRAVIAISALLVAVTLATAVITSSPPANATSSRAAPTRSLGSETPSAEATTGGTPSGNSSAATATATAPATAPATTNTAATKAPANSSASSSLALAASPAGLLAFDTKSLATKAGTATITFTNKAPLEHNLTIAQGSAVLGATPTFSSGVRKLTLKLKPGTYTFYCSVPGHRQAGMEGRLTVS